MRAPPSAIGAAAPAAKTAVRPFDFGRFTHTWEPLRSCFGDLTVRVFERGGYAQPYEEPELFDVEWLRWLDDLRGDDYV